MAFIWDRVHQVRRFLYNRHFLKVEIFKVPVISIGNLTFGGTGKTPLTLWLSHFLNEESHKTLILMRGHKGELESSSGWLKGGQKFYPFSPYFGDEPLILARHQRNGDVVVGKNRVRNLKYYFEKLLPHVVLLDDGFQHLRIHRKLDIVLFDSLCPLEQYQVFPLGRLRETLNSLQAADVVVLNRCNQVTAEKLNQLTEFLAPYLSPAAILAKICYHPTGFYSGNHELLFAPGEMSGQRVLAVAGLGSPQSFFQQLEALGVHLVERKTYPDHHYFGEKDIEEMLTMAEKLNAMIVVSEKDMVKIRRETLTDRILYLGIKIEFLEGEELLKEKIRNLF